MRLGRPCVPSRQEACHQDRADLYTILQKEAAMNTKAILTRLLLVIAVLSVVGVMFWQAAAQGRAALLVLGSYFSAQFLRGRRPGPPSEEPPRALRRQSASDSVS